MTLFFSFTLFASTTKFIARNDNILPDSAVVKMDEIASELYAKTGVSLYIHACSNVGDGGILAYEKNVINSLSKPYVLLAFALQEQKVDMVVSDDLKTVVNTNSILNEYIIPIIVSKNEGDVNSQYSAAMLNGVSEAAERVASSKDVKLDSAIGSESKNVIEVVRFIFYGVIVVAFLYYLRNRFMKKEESAKL